jgi:phosphatidylinositol-bisphosphatase
MSFDSTLPRKRHISRIATSTDDPIQDILQQAETAKQIPLRILIGSFNLNGQQCTLNDIKLWLDLTTKKSKHVQNEMLAPDMIVLGFQEFDSAIRAYLKTDINKQSQWTELVRKCLNETLFKGHDVQTVILKDPAIDNVIEILPVSKYVQNSYSLLEMEVLVGMLLLVFVKESKRSMCHHVMKTNIGVGLLGFLGNKGAVAIRMRIQNDTFCFINAHFTSHRNNWKKRNENYHRIIHELVFYEKKPKSSSVTNKENYRLSKWMKNDTDQAIKGGYELEGDPNIYYTLLDHDYVFFLGDLNYRIEMDSQVILKAIEHRKWKRLLSKDQLILSKEQGHIFKDFIEPPIEFPPTFKFHPNTSQYHIETTKRHDMLEQSNSSLASEGRSPGWCDRILFYQAKYTLPIECLLYEYVEDVILSDHKPIRGLFKVFLDFEPRKKRIGGGSQQQIPLSTMYTMNRLYRLPFLNLYLRLRREIRVILLVMVILFLLLVVLLSKRLIF